MKFKKGDLIKIISPGSFLGICGIICRQLGIGSVLVRFQNGQELWFQNNEVKRETA